MYVASSATLVDGRLRVRFEKINTELTLKTDVLPKHIVFSIESVNGDSPDSIWFVNIQLDLQGSPNEAFGACLLALNLKTRVDALPALQRDLRGIAEHRLGLVGARAAIVAAPMGQMLPALQDALATSSELPVCKTAGPWAGQVPLNRSSYLFNFGSLSLTNLQEWVHTVQSLGFTQIDNHGGGDFFRFGDFELNAARWPDGWAAWEKTVLPTLRKAGISSIFHTYAFFIDKRSKYVSPVPDARLDAFRTFTLAKSITADASEIVVNESTAGVSLITGFFEHNSVTLHIGDELVTFGGVSKEAPWTFTKVSRGVYGTKAAAHQAGAKARHLKELFGLFVPDVDSTLFEEIAANHADVVNRCGFDGIYLDAIDGSSILRGDDQAWYWAGKFVVAIQKRLNTPIGMEMSAMWHPFWQYRTRWQAWDFPRRGHIRFNDLHAESINGGLLLPLHLGWWSFHAFNPPQVDPTYPEVMETLGARLVGWGAGASLTEAVGRDALSKTPLYARAVEILRTSEELRRSGFYNEQAKARLREPGSEYQLFTNSLGQTRFRKMQSFSHVVSVAEAHSLGWRITNAFPTQPAKFRIEALMSASAGSTSAIVLADFAKVSRSSRRDDPTAQREQWKRSTAPGVSLGLGGGGERAVLSAANAGQVPRKGAWARLEKQFDPPLDLSRHESLAVEVEGDGSGALLAVRLESPEHIAFGAVADRYVVLDFTGRRTLTLVETESSRWSDFDWNDAKSHYAVYREMVNFGVINKVSVWLQNVPPDKGAHVTLGAIRAVPMEGIVLKNPVITVGDKQLAFGAEVPAGGWIECDNTGACEIYGPNGAAMGKATVSGEWPQIPKGGTILGFGCDVQAGSPRARVVVFTVGDEI